MKVSKYHLSPAGHATIRAAATLMGMRLARLRKQREATDRACPVAHTYTGGPIIGHDMPALPVTITGDFDK